MTLVRTEPCPESRHQLVEKCPQIGRRLELRNGIELLERACKRVRQAPHRSRRKLRIFRLEVQPVHFGQKASRCLQFAIDKSSVEDELGTVVRDLPTAPLLDLPLHGLEVALDSIHSDSKGIDQVETLAVLG